MERVISFSRGVAAAVGLSALALLIFSQGTTLRDGYVVLTRQGASPLPVATALFSFSNPQGELISEAGVAAVAPIRRGRIFVAPGLNTGLALANPLNQPVLVQLTLRDANGVAMPPATSVSLAPRAHLARYIQGPGGFFPGLSPQFTGSLTFEAAQPVGAVTLRQAVNENGELLLATLPVVNLDAVAAGTTVVFPQLGVGVFPFAGRQVRISTQIVLINRTGQAAAGEIRLTRSDGGPLVANRNGESGSVFSYQLAPNGVFSTEFTSQGATQAGYAEVVPSGGSPLPAGTALFLYNSNQAPISEAGVAAGQPTRRARIFVDNNGTTTGVALASPGNGAMDVEFQLLDRNGVAIGSTSRSIDADGQLAVNVDQLFPLPDAFTGQMEISADADFVPVTLKLTINSRNDLVLTTLPVADLQRPVEGDTLIFPQIGLGSAAIGSFATRLIFINIDADDAAIGTMAFFTGAQGDPLELALAGQRDSQFPYDVVADGARQFFADVEAELASLTLDQSNLVVNQGGTGGLRPITLDTEGNARDDFPLTFTSLNPATVQVDGNGTLTGLQRGFATVTVQSGAFLVNASVTVATITAGPAGFEVSDVKRDSSDRIYLTNAQAHTVLRADSVSDSPAVFAGVDRLAGFNGGPRLTARFDEPAFMAINVTARLIYVSDPGNNWIRAVDYGAAGTVDRLAGHPDRAPGAVDGGFDAVRFNNPQGVALDVAGGLWVVDTGNHTIRRIDLVSGMVTTVAGSAGNPGSSDGLGGQARFNAPIGIAQEVESVAGQIGGALGGQAAQEVRMIVADTGNGLLRRLTLNLAQPAAAQVETVEAAAAATVSLGGGRIHRQLNPVRFESPTGVVVDAFGNIYVSEPDLARVRLLLTTGEVVQAAQTGTFRSPRGLDITTAGRVVVAETFRGAQEIRYAGPSIGQVSPDRFSARGGERVTVTGNNFATDSRVLLGGILVPGVSVDGTTRLSFTTPPDLPSGRTTLTVQHRGGLDQEDVVVQPVPTGDLGPGEITTIAGGRAFGGDQRRSLEASLRQPSGIVFDSAGNLIIADAINNRIRRVNPDTRVINTIAGAGRNRLQVPVAVAVDAMDNVLITDTNNHRILRWNRATRTLEAFAGTGRPGFSGDGGPATGATFFTPAGIAVADNGDVFVSDSGNGRIRRIDAETNLITTFAGGQTPSGSATVIRLPVGLAFDSAGNLHAADIVAQRVWRISPSGQLSVAAGSGLQGFSGDGGAAVAARLNTPYAVAFDSSDNLLIADAFNHRARLVSAATGVIRTLAGNGVAGFSGDGQFAGAATLSFPTGVAFSDADEAYITDTDNHRVRVVSASNGIISTYVGNGLIPDTGDGGTAIAAALNFPEGLAFDSAGRLHLADSDHHRVRRLLGVFSGAGFPFRLGQSGGIGIETVAGTGERGFFGDGEPAIDAAFIQPRDVAFDEAGDLLIADSGNHRVRRVSAGQGGLIPSLFGLANTAAGGAVATLAGNGQAGFSGDNGQGVEAALNRPANVAVLGDLLFIADRDNHRIRVLNLQSRVISTLAGNGEAGFSGDGGPADQASLNLPSALEVGREGQSDVLYVADTGNHRVRRLTLVSRGPAVITTLAGNGQAGFSGDGGSPRSASLNRPRALALDDQGRLLIADSGNNRVRRVDLLAGRIETVAGNGEEGFSGDGGPALQARFNAIGGLAVDAEGNIYVSDLANHRIRFIRRP